MSGEDGAVTDRSFGEADHIEPLWAGGEHTPQNFQLLCQPCHKAKTKIEAAQRARARKAARQWELEAV